MRQPIGHVKIIMDNSLEDLEQKVESLVNRLKGYGTIKVTWVGTGGHIYAIVEWSEWPA